MMAASPITTALQVQHQGINIDIESIAPIRQFSADAYDVANMTITATVTSPSDQLYRLVLAADVEAGTSAFVRVVSASKAHFKDLRQFKRIVKKDAELLRPVLAKAGIAVQPGVDEQQQLEEHAKGYKVADITIPAGQQVLRTPRQPEAQPRPGQPPPIPVHRVRPPAQPGSRRQRPAGCDGDLPAGLQGHHRHPGRGADAGSATGQLDRRWRHACAGRSPAGLRLGLPGRPEDHHLLHLQLTPPEAVTAIRAAARRITSSGLNHQGARCTAFDSACDPSRGSLKNETKPGRSATSTLSLGKFLVPKDGKAVLHVAA